ncbi:HTH-type transcriptional regulator YofA [Serratia entomophila]|uniref:LysR substrate-binding domain-containing protein n=1 Tax=Serratia entomophila TaxID=42906 RepID=UPI001F216CA9|nr:LysR substrate-binding domain-containing protein [Serratia entomophila]UIW19750.1 LysR family transcriptional regulator [Serratia entomophila]CAI0717516.1 HTH-type transcriptional regulator YofA [Serratia entomophila]CAI0774875.1 HTH-type transcriptional regulator YofA [Serratia entomophila]CAI0775437.1 HTH-type transcriptional regulator YofA [Serratia entomophila]CAI0775638.1 HTH-type transcriptional regulator YofA [Serratia entomophila]
MGRITFDLEDLRSYVTGIELGSFAKAAERLGRSTSAVSAHLKKLEQQAGAPILRKVGRGMVMTEAGETLLGYARRLLELNDEAAAAVRGLDLQGMVRLGLQEDFGETFLPQVLGSFARANPKVRIEARIARNAELIEWVLKGQLDLSLAWNGGLSTPFHQALGERQLHWIASANADLTAWQNGGDPLPLVMFDAPCLMRSAAIQALDRAGIPWRIAFTSRSLNGVWAAVSAGLGVTVRTDAGLPPGLVALAPGVMPALGRLGVVLHRAEDSPSAAIQRLAQIVIERIES